MSQRFPLEKYPVVKRDGKYYCRFCGSPCPRGRRSYCSDSCQKEMELRFSSAYVRKQVFERDKGICALCGCNADKLEERVRRIWHKLKWERGRDNRMDRVRRLLGVLNLRETLWNADHITPVVKGGGGCGLDNYRTLCIWCHKKETAKLRRNLSVKAKARDEAEKRQKILFVEAR